ncbi:hypothetical protein BDD12DRAFT_162913 [Trichophaea hybrida]|nr:hypothetical protein BDD12DRAFT_162913 [Trichophaea hybrida]
MFTTTSIQRTLATSPLLTTLIHNIISRDTPYQPLAYSLALSEVRRLRKQHTLRLFVLLLITLISTTFILRHCYNTIWLLITPVLCFITIVFTIVNEFADTSRKKLLLMCVTGLLHVYVFWLFYGGCGYLPIIEVLEWAPVEFAFNTVIMVETAEEEFLRYGVKRRLDGIRMEDQAALESMILKWWYEKAGVEVERNEVDGVIKRDQLLLDSLIFQKFLELVRDEERQGRRGCGERNDTGKTA